VLLANLLKEDGRLEQALRLFQDVVHASIPVVAARSAQPIDPVEEKEDTCTQGGEQPQQQAEAEEEDEDDEDWRQELIYDPHAS